MPYRRGHRKQYLTCSRLVYRISMYKNLRDQNAMESNFVNLSAGIVSAYIAKNHIQRSELPELIASVHGALSTIGKPTPQPDPLVPPVPIKKSVTLGYLISMEDGRRYKALRRHLT